MAALAFLHEVQLDSFQGAGTEIPRDPTSHLQALAGQAAQSHFNSNGGNTEAFLATLHKQSLTTLSRALQRIEHYWAGAAYATNILSQRQSGRSPFSNHSSEHAERLISLHRTELFQDRPHTPIKTRSHQSTGPWSASSLPDKQSHCQSGN